jgi:serine/threonine protein kinase
MHGLKIVHGDIKANNMLVTPNGRVFLCDFGLSQILELQSLDGAYSITSLGNLRWASPELIEGEQEDCDDIPRTFQSDVWAFGMTIYQVHCRSISGALLTNLSGSE